MLHLQFKVLVLKLGYTIKSPIEISKIPIAGLSYGSEGKRTYCLILQRTKAGSQYPHCDSTTCNSNSKGYRILFLILWASVLTCAHKEKHTYTHNFKINLKNKYINKIPITLHSAKRVGFNSSALWLGQGMSCGKKKNSAWKNPKVFYRRAVSWLLFKFFVGSLGDLGIQLIQCVISKGQVLNYL